MLVNRLQWRKKTGKVESLTKVKTELQAGLLCGGSREWVRCGKTTGPVAALLAAGTNVGTTHWLPERYWYPMMATINLRNCSITLPYSTGGAGGPKGIVATKCIQQSRAPTYDMNCAARNSWKSWHRWTKVKQALVGTILPSNGKEKWKVCKHSCWLLKYCFFL